MHNPIWIFKFWRVSADDTCYLLQKYYVNEEENGWETKSWCRSRDGLLSAVEQKVPQCGEGAHRLLECLPDWCEEGIEGPLPVRINGRWR